MKNKTILLTALFFSLSVHAGDYRIDASVLDSHDIGFEPHAGIGPFDSYLIQKLNYKPLAPVFEDLQKHTPKPLKNRGEGHITVVTPVEYFNVLKAKLTPDELNQIAVESNIQDSHFNVICLGKGSVENKDTYFLVLDAPDLLKIRQKISEVFVQKGGEKEAFNPKLFFPHVTIGFTDQDLHYEQGVIKDRKSCIGRTKITH